MSEQKMLNVSQDTNESSLPNLSFNPGEKIDYEYFGLRTLWPLYSSLSYLCNDR